MSAISQLFAEDQFRTIADYENFSRELNLLLKQGVALKIQPKLVSKWDAQAEFYKDSNGEEFYVLHHPEPPSRGEWKKVDIDYLGGSYQLS